MLDSGDGGVMTNALLKILRRKTVRKLRRKNAWELPVLHGTEAPMADAARVLVVKVATEKAVTLADEPARRLIPTARQASRAILALCLSGGTILVITGEEEIVRRPCHNI